MVDFSCSSCEMQMSFSPSRGVHPLLGNHGGSGFSEATEFRQSLRQRKDCSMFGIIYCSGGEKETQSLLVLSCLVHWDVGNPLTDNGSSDSNAAGDVKGECNCIHFDETSPWMGIQFMGMV